MYAHFAQYSIYEYVLYTVQCTVYPPYCTVYCTVYCILAPDFFVQGLTLGPRTERTRYSINSDPANITC